MSSFPKIKRGGLLLDPQLVSDPRSTSSHRGADVSWLSKCRVGDDQGSEGACAIFAMASWAEIMHGNEISNEACLQVYREALIRLRRTTGAGLTFSEAFDAVRQAGWLPGASAMVRVFDFFELPEQPIVAGYSVTAALDNVSPQGCLDHDADSSVRGYHALVIVAHGMLNNVDGGPWVYIENSWGLDWGWNGIGLMSEELHTKLCREMWVII